MGADVTALLLARGHGDQAAFDQLVATVQQELSPPSPFAMWRPAARWHIPNRGAVNEAFLWLVVSRVRSGGMAGMDPFHRRLFAPDLSLDRRWIAFFATPLFEVTTSINCSSPPGRWPSGRTHALDRPTGLEHFDADPHWSRDGKTIYFNSDRDGSTCLWALRLDPATKKPLGEPYAIRHFHPSPRHYSDMVRPVFPVGPDRIVITL